MQHALGSSSGCRIILGCFATVLVMMAAQPAPAGQVAKLEAKCSSKLAKGALKLSTTAVKETVKCRNADISGKTVGSCPNAKGQSKINRAQAKLIASAAQKCGSVCSVSQDLSCLTDALCPPVGTGSEKCSAGAKSLPFDMGNIGFPGPFCESILQHEVLSSDDLASCVAGVTSLVSDAFVAAIFGSTTNASGISSQAAACLASAAKAATKLMFTVAKRVSKCRDAINAGKRVSNPASCAVDDAKLIAKAAKAETKLRAMIERKCTDSAITELDLCGNGPGMTTTRAAAADCLAAAAREIADSNEVPVLRSYGMHSLIDGPYPPQPVCGDGVVNQLPNPLLLLGEECDGSDDSACPGQCLPPGGTFECSCGNIPRIRFIADGPGTDSDAGWEGGSHEQQVADRGGYVTSVQNCNCTAMTDATCTGTSSDPVCDLGGYQLPVCSWNLSANQRCDAVGNGNGLDQDRDCYICDQFSANSGAFCRDEGDCQSRCFDADGNPTANSCSRQSDCPSEQICRGRCDRSQTCIISPNGAPLPVSAAGTAVCAVQRFRTDVTGTRDLVTGAHAINYRLFSVIHTGERVTVPCPVCGGFCEGGAKDGELCQGTCETSGGACRFDSDCPGGELCTPASPQCPGGSCQLSLVCGGGDGGQNPGNPCAIEYTHPLFGTLSNDCLPSPGKNITGIGFEIDYLPGTSGHITLPSTVPCTAQGLELFDCPCPDGGGQPTKPNSCAPACNAPGPNFAVGCADGNSSGAGTTCATGPNAGKLCDDDGDCPGSSCSANPTHCSGDPAFERFACTTNADCGSGSCVDACPGGRCLPLCVPVPDDPYDGTCAAGPPVFHCEGAVFSFRTCKQPAAEGSCNASCSGSGTPCLLQTDCPAGQSCSGECQHAQDCEAGPDAVIGTADDIAGSGACVADLRNCYLDPVEAEGGTTLNGRGDPTNVNTVNIWCFTATSNPGINASAGFGGPGRVRIPGLNVANFTTLP